MTISEDDAVHAKGLLLSCRRSTRAGERVAVSFLVARSVAQAAPPLPVLLRSNPGANLSHERGEGLTES